MDFKWIVKYEDETHVYEDGYLNEQTAKEYCDEAISQGFKNVSYFEKQ